MGRLPDSFLDELLARTDIVELIGRHVQLRRSGRSWVGLCPFHREKTPSFTVSPEKGLFYCFGCGKGGNAIGFVMEYEGLSFPEAVERLAGLAGMQVPRTGDARDRDFDAGLELLAAAAARMHEWLVRSPGAKHARDYAARRGLSEDAIARWRLGHAPRDAGWPLAAFGRDGKTARLLERTGLVREGERGPFAMFRDRLVFPIRDRQGRVVGFGGRALADGQQPKYLNTPETPWFQKRRLLFGLHEHQEGIRHARRVLVVEGYLDVIALHEAGIPLAVAPLGTAFSRGQAETLWRAAPELVLCMDGDTAGRRAAWRALEEVLPALTAERRLRFAFLPEGEDPDSFVRRRGAEAFARLLEQEATDAFAFWLEGLSRLAGGGVEGRARQAKLADRMLASMRDPYLREAWRQEAERAIGLHLGRAAAPEAAPPPAPDGEERLAPAEEQVLAGLLQKPARARLLPPEAEHFFLDRPGVRALYTRALALANEGEDARVAERLLREFPGETRLAAWASAPEIDDAAFVEAARALARAVLVQRLRESPTDLTQTLALRRRLEELSRPAILDDNGKDEAGLSDA